MDCIAFLSFLLLNLFVSNISLDSQTNEMIKKILLKFNWRILLSIFLFMHFPVVVFSFLLLFDLVSFYLFCTLYYSIFHLFSSSSLFLDVGCDCWVSRFWFWFLIFICCYCKLRSWVCGSIWRLEFDESVFSLASFQYLADEDEEPEPEPADSAVAANI